MREAGEPLAEQRPIGVGPQGEQRNEDLADFRREVHCVACGTVQDADADAALEEGRRRALNVFHGFAQTVQAAQDQRIAAWSVCSILAMPARAIPGPGSSGSALSKKDAGKVAPRLSSVCRLEYFGLLDLE